MFHARKVRYIWLSQVENIIIGMIVAKEKFLSEEVEDVFGKNKLRYAILSGPSFAQEILEHNPTIVVIASKDAQVFLCSVVVLGTDFNYNRLPS